jgi:hypothetical protein
VVEAGFQLTYTSYFPLDWLRGVGARNIREIGETLRLIDLTSQMNKHKGREGIVNLVDQNEAKLRALEQALTTPHRLYEIFSFQRVPPHGRRAVHIFYGAPALLGAMW